MGISFIWRVKCDDGRFSNCTKQTNRLFHNRRNIFFLRTISRLFDQCILLSVPLYWETWEVCSFTFCHNNLRFFFLLPILLPCYGRLVTVALLSILITIYLFSAFILYLLFFFFIVFNHMFFYTQEINMDAVYIFALDRVLHTTLSWFIWLHQVRRHRHQHRHHCHCCRLYSCGASLDLRAQPLSKKRAKCLALM